MLRSRSPTPQEEPPCASCSSPGSGFASRYFLEKGRLLPFGVHLTSTIAMLSVIMHNSRTSNMAGARRIERRE
eukprot:CAMPEP_0177732004 /NCGR_PEP_ID=MMETSP0484_2-20121128/22865_1 /TAXON_ID=354590 /ORGANISM="Rhodomonas lens, Strain RHODO" /LENGTH=72 /DNA_ID=CAMNT_0019245179 /DNA_START=255 /DNA_END=473 /DNA_ORIENTATION=+